jgi:preprotein translocase subunit SecY
VSREAAIWFLRFIPILGVVAAGVVYYLLAKRRAPVSYPPGRGLRIFDKDGNEIKSLPLRIVTAVVLAGTVIAVLAMVILPFTIP